MRMDLWIHLEYDFRQRVHALQVIFDLQGEDIAVVRVEPGDGVERERIRAEHCLKHTVV